MLLFSAQVAFWILYIMCSMAWRIYSIYIRRTHEMLL